MIHTFTIQSSKGLHKPSRFACTQLNFDVAENAALSLPVMLDGSIVAQSLGWGTKTISVSGSGYVAPHLDDVPLGEVLRLHAANQVSIILPPTITTASQATLEVSTAPTGYQWIRISVAQFLTNIQARKELHYEPVITALYSYVDDNGIEVLEVFEGENVRRGDDVYALVPNVYAHLRVSFFPIYDCFLTQPIKVTTDNNESNVSWTMEFVTRIDRSFI